MGCKGVIKDESRNIQPNEPIMEAKVPKSIPQFTRAIKFYFPNEDHFKGTHKLSHSRSTNNKITYSTP